MRGSSGQPPKCNKQTSWTCQVALLLVGKKDDEFLFEVLQVLCPSGGDLLSIGQGGLIQGDDGSVREGSQTPGAGTVGGGVGPGGGSGPGVAGVASVARWGVASVASSGPSGCGPLGAGHGGAGSEDSQKLHVCRCGWSASV